MTETTREKPIMQKLDLKPVLKELRELDRLYAPTKNAVEQILDRLADKLRRFIYNMPPPDERFRMEW